MATKGRASATQCTAGRDTRTAGWQNGGDVGVGREGVEEAAAAGFPIVGIGASAGGLAAFEAFFSGMSAKIDPGMAFVLVQHLAPDHKSILADLVRRYTRMSVFEVEDGVVVEPNCIYSIPPNRDMALLGGTLRLMEPSARRGQRLPIDFFFRSLAQDQRARAICIVLSGTGSDGSLGLQAIKSEGGMAMAQNPASAAYDGMPRSAIATGLVDYELPPAEMPAQLMAYVAQAFGALPRLGVDPSPGIDHALKEVFALVCADTGHDFSLYKPSTVHRRLGRRMAARQIDTTAGYLEYLRQTPAEVTALFHDLLIGVTSFFRDPEAFTALEQLVVPKLLASKPEGGPIRVWSVGCSTGEEAYSLAILLRERQEALGRSYNVQVFASDIDGRAIASARSGIYSAANVVGISPERRTKYLVAEPDGGSYRIRRDIRDMLVFSEQDVIRDPPFSRLDLISCRNLLIYMGGELQRKLIALFHYALNPGGFLLLGTSETLGEWSHLFATLDRRLKLCQRKEGPLSARRAVPGRRPPLAATEATASPVDGNAVDQTGTLLRGNAEEAPWQGVIAAGLDGRPSGKQLETANEELESSNQEMQSVNEELQSTNEELETSKEELQSLNEELATLNAELQTKVVDLSRVNNDMNNLLAGTGIGTVFVDRRLRILRFTPSATEMINLIPSDVGRPVGHILSKLVGYDRLVEDVQAVLDTLVNKEVDVRTLVGDWYSMRLRPYRTLDNVVEGAVITFVDVTAMKKVQDALKLNERRLAGVEAG